MSDGDQPAVAAETGGTVSRRLKRLAIGVGVLALLIVVGVLLAVINRTSLLEWAIEAYLTDETIKSVSLAADAFDTEHLHIREFRLAGDTRVAVKDLRIDYELESIIGGALTAIRATDIRLEQAGTVSTIKEIVGDGRFDFGFGGMRRLQAALDILRLTVDGHPFEPGRVEIDFDGGRLALEAAIGAEDGFLAFVGNGPLGKAPDGFKMQLTGRLNAAPITALLGPSVAASGPVDVSISGTTDDPFYFLQEARPKDKKLPDHLTLAGRLALNLTALRVGETELPAGGADRVDFSLTNFKTSDDAASAALTVDVTVDKRDTAEFGFDQATLRLMGELQQARNNLTVSIRGGDLVQLRNLRVADGGPVQGDMSLTLIGSQNALILDLDKGSVRHRMQGRLAWNAGKITIQSEGDLNEESDPLVVTLRGEFDATPFLAVQPALRDATGMANVFLAGRISQVLDLMADGPPDRDWAGSVRLDGAFKLDLAGLQIPDTSARRTRPGTPAGTPRDSLEISLKGFNGSGGHHRGKLRVTAALDGRRYSGIEFERVRLTLNGRLELGSKGYKFLPVSESALTFGALTFDNGFAIPEGVTFQLTGADNHVSVAPTLDSAEHELSFAHLEVDGLFDAGKRKRQPVRLTVPQFGSRKSATAPYHLYATGGALELPTLQLTASGINLSVEDRADEIDIGLEAADVRHGARPPMTKPFAISVKGKIKQDTALAVLQAKQRFGPLVVRGKLDHNLRSQAGRIDFDMPTVTLAPKKFTLADLFPPGADWFDDARGKTSLKGHLLWDKNVLSGQMSVKLDDVHLTSDDFRLKEVNGTIAFIELVPLVMPPRQRLKGLVSYGELGPIPAQLEFQLREDGKVAIQDLDLTMAGGRLNTRGLVQTDKGLSAEAAIGVRSVDLKELLQLIGVDGLNGTGKLSGSIPVRITDGKLVISDGNLRALGPGRLRYAGSALEKQLSARKDTAGTVSKVLSDFRYQKLTLRLDKEAQGLGTILLHMEGSNPAVYEGHPFAFNIRIESDFDKLGRIAFGGAQTFSEALKRAGQSTDAE